MGGSLQGEDQLLQYIGCGRALGKQDLFIASINRLVLAARSLRGFDGTAGGSEPSGAGVEGISVLLEAALVVHVLCSERVVDTQFVHQCVEVVTQYLHVTPQVGCHAHISVAIKAFEGRVVQAAFSLKSLCSKMSQVILEILSIGVETVFVVIVHTFLAVHQTDSRAVTKSVFTAESVPQKYQVS